MRYCDKCGEVRNEGATYYNVKRFCDCSPSPCSVDAEILEARDSLYALAKELNRKPRHLWSDLDRIAHGCWMILTTAEINE